MGPGRGSRGRLPTACTAEDGLRMAVLFFLRAGRLISVKIL